MKKRNCFIGQSGGPTAAINASLAGVIAECVASQQFEHAYGMINGIKGLLENHYIDLLTTFADDKSLDELKCSPAMYLGSCRYKLPTYQEDPQTYQTLFQTFHRLSITDFYYIGGNDSMDTVAKLSEYAKTIQSPIRFVGIPKTIDNDLMGTDHTPGFGSAAKYVATSMLEIAYDSSIYKLDAVTIVEIMGRNAGWLTAASALARTSYSQAPDLIYLPEVPFSKEQFLNDIRQIFQHKKNIIIAVSEGIKDENGQFLDSDSKYTKRDAFGHVLHSGTGKVLESLVYQEFKCKVRSIELNVLQRCAMHIASQVDLDESFMIGKHAVKASLANQSGIMMVFQRLGNTPYQIEYSYQNVCDIANLEQRIPTNWIHDNHHDITEKLYDYLLPLIQGEVAVSYHNGIPQYADIRHLTHD